MNEIDRIVEANKDGLLRGIDQLLAGAALTKNVSIDNLEFGGIEEDSLSRAQRARADIVFGAESMNPDIPSLLANMTESFPNESDQLYGRVIHTSEDDTIDYTDFVDDHEEIDDEDDGQTYLF